MGEKDIMHTINYTFSGLFGCFNMVYLVIDLLTHAKAPWLFRIALFKCLAFIAVFHVCLLMPGVDAGIRMYGGLLINKGYEPHHHLWNNKPTLTNVLAAAGFFVKPNPFLGVRIIELLLFTGNPLLVRCIEKIREALSTYHPVMQHERFIVYERNY
jgi:hypothetical protein